MDCCREKDQVIVILRERIRELESNVSFYRKAIDSQFEASQKNIEFIIEIGSELRKLQ